MAAFLVDLTKLGVVAERIKEYALHWIRPLLALTIAVTGGIGLGLARGVSLGLAVAEGIIAGMSSIGFHELWTIVASYRSREKRSIV